MSAHCRQREIICSLSSPKLIESRKFAAALDGLIHSASDEGCHLPARYWIAGAVGRGRGAVGQPRKVRFGDGAEEAVTRGHVGEYEIHRPSAAGARLCGQTG